jgi:hypothetical protein
MSIGRRAFLKAGLGTGAAAAAFPAWSAGLARAGGDAVAERIRAARAIGKPVLALLVPDAGDASARMYMWAELFSVADDATLAELALCEVVFARNAGVVAAARAAGLACPELGPEDVAVLLETDGEPARLVSGAGLPEVGSAFGFGAREDGYDASVRKRAAGLAARVRRAILPGETSLAKRATAAHGTFDMREQMSVVLDHYPRPRLTHLDRGAAIVLADARAEADAAQRAAKESNLARAALQRLWEHAPAGAAWSSSTGYCPPCGMGYTPAVSRHFLSFYAG